MIYHQITEHLVLMVVRGILLVVVLLVLIHITAELVPLVA